MDKHVTNRIRNTIIVGGACALLFRGCDSKPESLEDMAASNPVVEQIDTNYVSNTESGTYSSNDLDSIYHMGY
jgi:hypothetical protein